LATWSPLQHHRQRPIRPRGAPCPEFLHSRGVTCACQKATFAPITGRHGRVDQLHVRPVSGHAVEDEIASWAPLAWVCAGDGRATSNGRLVCDRPTRRTLPDASLPPPPHGVLEQSLQRRPHLIYVKRGATLRKPVSLLWKWGRNAPATTSPTPCELLFNEIKWRKYNAFVAFRNGA